MLREATSEVYKLCDKPVCAGNCRLLQIPGVQHPGIVFPVVACMSRNRDCADVFGSRVRHKEKAHGAILAVTDCLLCAAMSIQLHTLADVFPVERKHFADNKLTIGDIPQRIDHQRVHRRRCPHLRSFSSSRGCVVSAY